MPNTRNSDKLDHPATDDDIFTTVVHAGNDPDAHMGSMTTPIYRTSVYSFDTLETAAAVHEGEQPGYFYGRMGNPTQAAFEAAVAKLEGAEAALGTASGMSAIAYALLTILEPGDEVVTQPLLYTTTRLLLDDFLTDHGISIRYASGFTARSIISTFTDKTKVVFVETPANPTLAVVDLKAVATAARSRGIMAVADNTFATPFNQTPIAHGFDVVCHSATKYLGGHGDLMAGVLVGPPDVINKARWNVNKLLGSVISPDSAWLALRGLRTLAVRMDRHNSSALALATWLDDHPAVDAVYYPGLASHPDHDVAARQMRAFGGMLSFAVADADAAESVVNSVKLCTLGVSLGDVATLIQVSGAMTQAALHQNRADDDGSVVGDLRPGLIRLSVGLESVDDLQADLDAALTT